MAGEMRYLEEKNVDFHKIKLIGEVDIYTSVQLKEKLYKIAENKIDLRLDCEELKYIDSTGLGVLVGALKKVKENNKEIVICNLKENVKKLFTITGLDKLFIIEE